LRRGLADFGDALGTIQEELSDLAERSDQENWLTDSLGVEHEKLKRLAEQVEFNMKMQAASGVRDVRIRPVDKRNAAISIDHGSAFTLTKTLWVLLEILCMNDGKSDDSFVGFKSLEEIAAGLSRRLSKEITAHAVEQALSRLRAELRKSFDGKNKANPHLVDTRRRIGVRFLLRKDGQLVISQ